MASDPQWALAFMALSFLPGLVIIIGSIWANHKGDH